MIRHRRLRRASLRDGFRTNPDSGGLSEEWVSRHVGTEGVADRGARVQLVQPSGAPAGPVPPDPLQGKLADVMGYPLSSSPVIRSDEARRAVSVLLAPVNHGQ